MMILSFFSKIKEFIDFVISNTKFDIIDKLSLIYEHAGKFWAPFLWIFFPWLESVLSPMPLTVIVACNISAARNMFGSFLGYVIGYLCSYIGETLGAITMFCFYRYVIKKLLLKGAMKSDRLKAKIENYQNKVVTTSGAGPLFILIATPYSPSAIVNLAYGMSSISTKTFIITTVIGKSIMILLLSFFAKPFEMMMDNLLYMIIGLIIMMLLWYVAKKLEPKMQRFTDKIAKKINKYTEKNKD